MYRHIRRLVKDDNVLVLIGYARFQIGVRLKSARVLKHHAYLISRINSIYRSHKLAAACNAVFNVLKLYDSALRKTAAFEKLLHSSAIKLLRNGQKQLSHFVNLIISSVSSVENDVALNINSA
ncbi:MAG: hypothetical protein E7485_05945 [Ruminococcaceae bacterium]|nr:hypothetical protein [Oscillospiraceae bacterium]